MEVKLIISPSSSADLQVKIRPDKRKGRNFNLDDI